MKKGKPKKVILTKEQEENLIKMQAIFSGASPDSILDVALRTKN